MKLWKLQQNRVSFPAVVRAFLTEPLYMVIMHKKARCNLAL